MPDSDRIRRIDPPRPVEVLHDGRWVRGEQDGWVWWSDEQAWRASVRYFVDHEWGRGQHIRSVPEDDVRLVD